MAAHIQYDPTISPTQALCGFCLRPSPLCQIFLKKRTGRQGTYQIDYTRSNCPNLSTNQRLRYNQAAKSTSTSPCSNVPIVCPLCPDHSAAVWTYFLELHFATCHKLRPQNFPIRYEVSASEKTALKEIWNNRFKKEKRRKGTHAKVTK